MATPQPQTPAKADGPPRDVPTLTIAQIVLAEAKRAVWHVDVRAGTEPGDLESVAYWAHVAHELRPFARLECWCEDGSWYAECLVIDAGHNWAKVLIKEVHKIESFKADRRVLMLPGHTVRWSGNIDKWRLERDADKKVIKGGFPSESAAYDWVAEYAKSIGVTGVPR